VLARQRQEAILREVDHIGGARSADEPGFHVKSEMNARRVVSEQVGQLIEAQLSDGEADHRPRKVKSS
jgi:hypothetical protein